MILNSNNVLYVIIISAALDLVPAEVPTGVILMADITPSLLIKIGWPYLVSGQVRYTRRVISCSAISFMGMIVSLVPSFYHLELQALTSIHPHCHR